MSDRVNHPSHYNQGKYETIDVILDTVQHIPGREGFLVGNIIKYLNRWPFKNGREDLEKAKRYLGLLIDLIDEED
ncbi:DUF3310 domain-containing protein [Amphibacillus sp. MSJ-3]|uniref:DUF3310 domain-containing protein n=1 Tax=Amphibacillus sp. MSJ-3 TaxID=2841505 RepID=UPI001C0ED872|nr:DUF3310 domain-containing protein [Amphibacillus sp. MSJ-3]